MVRKESPVYLFAGEDAFSKDARIGRLRQESLDARTQYFDSDLLYARDLNLKNLQEKLLSIPLGTKKRMVIIRGCQNLKPDIKGFLLKYARKPDGRIILVLDMDKYSSQDEFVRQLSRFAEVCRFKEEPRPDAFVLSRAIDLRKAHYALSVLGELLRNGEKPERILGGLRYSWENSGANAFESRRKLALLLNCDIDVKTGRLRPEFSLERLVVNLCSLPKPLR